MPIYMMHLAIYSIPIIALLLSVTYIFNDRIAVKAESRAEAKSCYGFRCSAERCHKQTLVYI